MRKVYLLLLCCIANMAGYAQTAASYSFSRSTGTFTSISGDAGVSFITGSGTMATDDGSSLAIPIGFPFSFCGAQYTDLAANSNGWISLPGIIPGTIIERYTPDTANISGPGWLMPLWDDLYGVGDSAFYETTGLPGSRVFTIEWHSWATFDDHGVDETESASLFFQVKLFEGTNAIQFVYGSSSLPPTNATIGIANSATDLQTLPLISSTTTDNSFNTGLTQPADGSILQWCPPPGPINGSVPVCVNATITLSDTTAGGTWTSDITSIATVDVSTGVVTGVTGGTTAIIFTSGCGSVTTTIVTVNPLPSLTVDSIAAYCAGGTSTFLSYSGLANTSSATTIFTYTGAVQTWTVPAGVTSILVDAAGASGGVAGGFSIEGTTPGKGGRVQTTLAVTPGQVLNIFVGGAGGDGGTGGAAGGYNGGGQARPWTPDVPTYSGGGGGGASDIRAGGTDLSNRIVVAGGGAGAGYNPDCAPADAPGGDGGNLIGGSATSCDATTLAGGGTQIAGGNGGTFETPVVYTPGSDGGFGNGGDNNDSGGIGGGGGGGYYGGGGGTWTGGGGGSSYTDATYASSVVHTQGYNTGNGQVIISYPIGSYSIVWDGTAHAQGFADLTDSTLSASPLPVPVSETAVAGTYNGTMTINNGLCTSLTNPVSVTVKPIPSVDPISSQTLCNAATTAEVDFSGPIGGTTYTWINSDTAIGLASSGGGDNILAFTATNGTFNPITGMITVTPTANGCVGPTQTFSITVNPTPDVAPSSNQTVCNGTKTAYIAFTGDVAGTTFNWTNSDTTIGLGATGTGDIDSFTATNVTPLPVSASFTVTTTANGCAGTSNSFTIVVNPTPMLSSILNPGSICNNTTFSYDPTSLTPGTTFNWSRDSVGGISNPAASGVDNPNETLVNTTTDPVLVTYVYSLLANGCSNTQSVTVAVNPTPMLTSPHTPAAICDSTAFVYVPTSATSGTTYTWVRDSVTGISNAAGAGVDSVDEVLENTTPDPIAVNYVITLTANSCTNTETVSVTVNPKPMLNTPLTPAAICDSTFFNYPPASLTTGTTFSWSRAVITGISNAAATGVDTVNERLRNTTANPIPVVYVYTLTANGCSNTQRVTVIVNPTPRLTSLLTPPSLCDSGIFNYTPTSATVGTTFAWSRAYVLGLGLPAATGTGNPNEKMINNTNDNLDVTYVYTLAANGCTNTQKVVVVVHPTPTLSSMLTPSVCSGAPFDYLPTGYVFGSTFTWKRLKVASISPATDTGSGPIHEVLVDSLLTPVTTTYYFTLKANGCSHTQNIVLTINPAPPAFEITTHSPSSVCANTQYQNFGIAGIPPAGQNFHWTAVNATVWAAGSNDQYCLVSFPNPGTAVVTLKSNLEGFNCITNSSYVVNVGNSVSELPEVIYYSGQFMCLQNNMDSYQWGYDDGVTLDSSLITGEINPNYFNDAPDFTYRHYWVMTVHNGCMQKVYYNPPAGITNANSPIDVKIYPNPTNNFINVDVNTTMSGNIEVQVMNMLGQKLNTTQAINNRARIDVANLPAGCYLVDCYREGVKVAAAKFIKN